MTIVKVQRCIMPADKTECLVYAKDKKRIIEQPIPDAAIEAMKKRKGLLAIKAFFEAKWNDSTNSYLIGKLVADQRW